jgi:fatty acid desaturase
MTRHQHLHVWFLSVFFAHSQRHLSQWGVLKAPWRFRRDLLPLALHFALWFAFPIYVLHLGALQVAAVYGLPLFFLGPYLAAIFWLNHIGMPLVHSDAQWSFLEHQSVTSRTVLNPPSMDWFFGGLNYQIEHHLYPKVPSFRLHRVQAIVQTRFAQEAIPYNGVGFVEAVRSIARHFRALAKGPSN